MKIISKGEKMGVQGWLVWADRAYFGAAIIAALATGITIVAGMAQNRLNARISEQKDRDLKAYQTSASVQIAAANQEAADAKKVAAEANQQTAELKAANLQLESQITPRRFDPASAKMSDLRSLLRMAPKTVLLQSYSLDPDGAILSTQIFEFLSSARFSMQDQRMTQGAGGSLIFGVWVWGKDQNLVNALTNVFRDARLITLAQQPPPPPMAFGVQFFPTTPDAAIFVGVKPLPGMQAPR